MNVLNLAVNLANFVNTSLEQGVLTITMNQPNKLNGWTMDMMTAFKEAFAKACTHDDVKVIIFTGVGRYYSAGVNLSSTIQLMHPKKLRALIIEHNQQLFDTFLDINKPIIIAVNGPAIGASVTSATLCNHIIAAEEAIFSTPFSALGVPPEGCSSVLFEKLIDKQNAQRMLGKEGWKPSAQEAKKIGLIQDVVPKEQLIEKAVSLAKTWIDNGTKRSYPAGFSKEQLKQVNKEESIALANAFLASKFLNGQAKFLWSKKKYPIAMVFFLLSLSRPLWARLL